MKESDLFWLGVILLFGVIFAVYQIGYNDGFDKKILLGYYDNNEYVCVKQGLDKETTDSVRTHEECHGLINKEPQHFCTYDSKGFYGKKIWIY